MWVAVAAMAVQAGVSMWQAGEANSQAKKAAKINEYNASMKKSMSAINMYRTKGAISAQRVRYAERFSENLKRLRTFMGDKIRAELHDFIIQKGDQVEQMRKEKAAVNSGIAAIGDRGMNVEGSSILSDVQNAVTYDNREAMANNDAMMDMKMQEFTKQIEQQAEQMDDAYDDQMFSLDNEVKQAEYNDEYQQLQGHMDLISNRMQLSTANSKYQSEMVAAGAKFATGVASGYASSGADGPREYLKG